MMSDVDATNDLRTSFDKDAERYSRYRPHYPDELFHKLVQTAKLTKASKLLEIGPGTGQATEPLAKLGCLITGIELGESLANKARMELRQYRNVHIITGPFEDVELPASTYDLIFSATAFHWIKDEYKFNKTAVLLRPKAYLAIIHTEHVSDDNGDEFFHKSKAIYNKYMSPDKPVSIDKESQLPPVPQLKAPRIDNQLFDLKSFDIFPWTVTYSAEEYVGLLSTYSPTITLPSDRRQNFLAAIAALINRQFGGKLEKKFAFTLTILQKK